MEPISPAPRQTPAENLRNHLRIADMVMLGLLAASARTGSDHLPEYRRISQFIAERYEETSK